MSIAGTIVKAVLDSLLGKIGSIFPWLRNWLDRPVIVPGRQRNWWHMGRTGDDRPSMQIATYWHVTNRTDRSINILNAYVNRPRTQGIVLTKDTRSAYHGSYPVPAYATTELAADFWINPPFKREGKSISDHDLDLIEAFIEEPKEFSDRIAEKIHSARAFRLGQPRS